MNTAANSIKQRAHGAFWGQRMSATGRGVAAAALLAVSLMGTALAVPATVSGESLTAPQPAASVPAPLGMPQEGATGSQSALSSAVEGASVSAAAAENAAPASAPPAMQPMLQMDLSVWGMFQHADAVVKAVMIGLILASVVTWAILFAKSAEIVGAKRRLRREQETLSEVRTLDEASELALSFSDESISSVLLRDAQNELYLSAQSTDNGGIKERTGFRLERRVAAASRHIGRGNGVLATIGAISPFVGLFGTVWGIMNSFIGIAHTQTTNLAVVAPGIAEALLATGLGLVAAIPAVVIYNIFARLIAGYRAQVGDVAAQVLLLLSRDLDLAASAGAKRPQQTLHVHAAG